MNTIFKPISKTGPMAKFIKIKTQCLLCHTTLPQPGFCLHCETYKKPQVEAFKQDKLQSRQEVRQAYAEIWRECQECQGGLDAAVICTSMDCPKFYKRCQLKKNKEKIEGIVEKMGVVDIEDLYLNAAK